MKNKTVLFFCCIFRLCEEGCLDRRLVEGTIVLCDRVIGIKEAYRAGALGSISVDGTFSDVSFVSPLPAVTLNQTNYVAIISYLYSRVCIPP